jgi:hypothetical protein
VLVADDKIKVVIVQPYQQSAEPHTEQLYMAVGSVNGEDGGKDKREWGTTAPDVEDSSDTGTKREMSFSSEGEKTKL